VGRVGVRATSQSLYCAVPLIIIAGEDTQTPLSHSVWTPSRRKSTLLLRIKRAIAAAHKGMKRYTMYLSIPLSLKDGCAGAQRVSHYIADPTCEMPLVSASSSA
jgi:hypothetical protein